MPTELAPRADDPTRSILAHYDAFELALLRMGDEDWRAMEIAQTTAKFLAGARTGNRSIDRLNEKIAQRRRERAAKDRGP